MGDLRERFRRDERWIRMGAVVMLKMFAHDGWCSKLRLDLRTRGDESVWPTMVAAWSEDVWIVSGGLEAERN